MNSLSTPAISSLPKPRAGLGFGALLAASIGVIVAQIGMVAVMQGVGIGGWGFLSQWWWRLRLRWPTPWRTPRWP